MKRVYRAASLHQVAHARNLLVAAGIECEIRNQYLAGAMGELPLLETWPQLLVEDQDEARSLAVLNRAAAPVAGEPWVCEACGERLEPQFTSCWRCGAESRR
jgi:Putative prokaryotic signal transducing protein